VRPVLTDGSIRPAHEPRQLGAGVDAQLGERIADVGFHRMKGKVQLGGDVAVGHALCDQVDDLELGIGETVPARFRPGWLTMRRSTPNLRNWRPTRRASARASWRM